MDRYLIFLGPLDVCYHLCSVLPVQLLLFTLEEVGRAKKIVSGVSAASALYPQSLVAMAVVGLLKGIYISIQNYTLVCECRAFFMSGEAIITHVHQYDIKNKHRLDH